MSLKVLGSLKKWQVGVLVLLVICSLVLLARPYVEGRLSWYYLDGRFDGRNLLLSCLTKEPILVHGGWSTEFENPMFPRFESYLACKATEKFKDELVTDVSTFYGENQTLLGLVTRRHFCSHPRFTETQIAKCHEKTYAAIDWMIKAGASLSPPDTCGYLHLTLGRPDEEMFNFLLSRGADPDQLCPPKRAKFGPGTEKLIHTEPETVMHSLEALLAVYTEERMGSAVAQWTRMLEKLRSRSK